MIENKGAKEIRGISGNIKGLSASAARRPSWKVSASHPVKPFGTRSGPILPCGLLHSTTATCGHLSPPKSRHPPAFPAGKFRFGGDQAAFDDGFEHGGAVALQIGLNALERLNPCFQPCELLLDLRYNPPLLGWRRDRKCVSSQCCSRDRVERRTSAQGR